MAAVKLRESKKRRNTALDNSPSVASGAARKAVKMEREGPIHPGPAAAPFVEEPVMRLQPVHPEIIRLRELAERKAHERALDTWEKEQQTLRAAEESGLEEAALRDPGPWYCTSPFARVCSKNAEHAVESYGSFSSAGDCLASCAPPKQVEELVMHYAQPAEIEPLVYGPPPEWLLYGQGVGDVYGPLSVERIAPNWALSNLRSSYEHVAYDGRVARANLKLAIDKQYRIDPRDEFTKEAMNRDSRYFNPFLSELIGMIKRGFGYLAAKDVLLYAPPWMQEQLFAAIDAAPDKAWQRWVTDGAFANESAQRELRDKLWTAVAWTIDHVDAGEAVTSARLAPYVRLLRYVSPATRQQLVLFVLNQVLYNRSPRLNVQHIPLLQKYINLFGCAPVLRAVLHVLPHLDLPDAYESLQMAQALASFVRQNMKDCELEVPGHFDVKLEERLAEAPLTVALASYFDQFRSPLPTAAAVARLPAEDVYQTNARDALIILLRALHDDLVLASPDQTPCERAQAFAASIVGRAMARALNDQRDTYEALRGAQADLAKFNDMGCKDLKSWWIVRPQEDNPSRRQLPVSVPRVSEKEDPSAAYSRPLPAFLPPDEAVVVDLRDALAAMIEGFWTERNRATTSNFPSSLSDYALLSRLLSMNQMPLNTFRFSRPLRLPKHNTLAR